MTTLDALLSAILAAPDDDQPRLVYADALDDAGEHDRAEFIRLQVEIGSDWKGMTEPIRKRHLHLWLDHRDEWFLRDGPLQLVQLVETVDAPELLAAVVDRGFIAELRGPLAALLQFGPAIVRANPVERVEVTDELTRRCPVCGGSGHWRSGVHFEHEKRCPPCRLVWEPNGKADWQVNAAVLARLRELAREGTK